MARPYFYYGTTRSYVAAFATILNGLTYMDGWGNIREVPLHYAPRQKWVEQLQKHVNMDQVDSDLVLPKVAFEFLSMTYAPTRNTNALNKLDNISSNTVQDNYILNRVAYDFNVKAYVAAVRFNDLLQILEQIIAFFNPSLTITLNDTNGLGFTTNIPINLNSIDYNIEYEGSFDTRRVISATLDFTMKGYQYSNPRSVQRIQEVIINLVDEDYQSSFDQIDVTASGPWSAPIVAQTLTVQSNTPGSALALPAPSTSVPSSSGSELLYAVAGVPLDYPRVVAVNNGVAYYPDLTNPNDVTCIVGVTTYAAAAGAAVGITTNQAFTEIGWSWAPGRIFCNISNGTLTQTAPALGAVIEVARVISPTTIHVGIQPAILR